MSNTSEITLVCANCGKVGNDVTNTCNKCKSVMYCNATCKKKHRSKHKKQCERRVAELHDEKLFKHPPPQFEDCPICFQRLPYLDTGRTYMNCCGKWVCSGCLYAVQSRVTERKNDVCPFCRTPNPPTDDEILKRLEKRTDLNDAIAIYNMGSNYSTGNFGLPQNHTKALELWHRAAELGQAGAYYNIGSAYCNGRGVEMDQKKAKQYWELAAMGGDEVARHNLGCFEGNAGNGNRALRHWMISVKDGYLESLKCIKTLYSNEDATKDDYAKALRLYQAYLDEIKSDQRDRAFASNEENRYYDSAV